MKKQTSVRVEIDRLKMWNTRGTMIGLLLPVWFSANLSVEKCKNAII